MILRKKSGQSLIEILVAIGVGVIMLVGAVTALTPAIKSLSDVSRTQGAASASKELLDNLRIFADANWHNIDTLSTSTKYFLNTATSTFVVATGTEGIIADGITSGLIGYWKLDEATGTYVGDFSGSGNFGTSTGTYATSGYIGGARKFNGVSDYIRTNSVATISTSSVSLCAWFRTINPSQAGQGVVYNGSDNSANGYGWFINKEGVSSGNIHLLYGGIFWFDTGIKISDSNWHHGCMVINSDGHPEFLLDGIVSYSGSSKTINLPTLYLEIGRNDYAIGHPGTARYFNGLIDDIRVYNRALSSTEINTIYRANIFTRSFQVSDVYRDSNDSDKIIEGTSGSFDPSTKKITIEYGWPGAQLKNFSAYFTRYRNKSFVQTSWQSGPGTAYTTTTASWFTTSSNINYSTSTGIRILGL